MNLPTGFAGLPTEMKGYEMEHKQLIVKVAAIFAANSAITALIVISLNMASMPLVLPWAV